MNAYDIIEKAFPGLGKIFVENLPGDLEVKLNDNDFYSTANIYSGNQYVGELRFKDVDKCQCRDGCWSEHYFGKIPGIVNSFGTEYFHLLNKVKLDDNRQLIRKYRSDANLEVLPEA